MLMCPSSDNILFAVRLPKKPRMKQGLENASPMDCPLLYLTGMSQQLKEKEGSLTTSLLSNPDLEGSRPWGSASTIKMSVHPGVSSHGHQDRDVL